jgi:hypothetical protein
LIENLKAISDCGISQFHFQEHLLEVLSFQFIFEMASPRTRRVLADLKPKDENSVSICILS